MSLKWEIVTNELLLPSVKHGEDRLVRRMLDLRYAHVTELLTVKNGL